MVLEEVVDGPLALADKPRHMSVLRFIENLATLEQEKQKPRQTQCKEYRP